MDHTAAQPSESPSTGDASSPPDPGLVSFVIPAHNEERFLAATLDSVIGAASARGIRSEVIVVDDSSTDATAAIAREKGVIVVPVQLRQIARVRNAGAAASRGGTLVFVDADTRISAEVLRDALAAIKAGAVGGGAYVRMDTRLSLIARGFMVLWRMISRFGGVAAGCFVYARREDFEAVGGFANDLFASEEVELSAALRKRGRFVIVRHEVVTSARKLESHSTMEILGLFARYLRRGRKMLTTREGLDIWYGPRAR